MKADKELTEYIQKRYVFKLRMLNQYESHGDDRFKHILTMGELSGLRDIGMVIGATLTECENCQWWGNVCGPDNYPDYVCNPKVCVHFIEKPNT